MIRDKRILFITDSCPPNLTMSGIVVKNLMDRLLPENTVEIIAIRQGNDDVAFYNGVRVRYVKSFPYYILSSRKNRAQANNRAAAVWYGLAEFVFRLFSIATRMSSPIGVNTDAANKLYRAVTRALRDADFDYVVCNAKPFESFEAVARVIEKTPRANTKFIAYQTDDFVSAGDERFIPAARLQTIKRNRNDRINDYVELFDVYGVLESVYAKEIASVHNRRKVKSMGIPLLFDKREERPAPEKGQKTGFVYAGSLVKSFRPPDGCLDILLELMKSGDFTADIYHRGDCGDVVDAYEKRSGGAVRNRGSVSAEAAYEAIAAADVLISISNVGGDQISGKTFDYISTCKPIIHFCYSEKDMNASVFRRYPRGLCINILSTDVKTAACTIREFLEETEHVEVSFDELLKEFGSYTVDEVVNMLFEG